MHWENNHEKGVGLFLTMYSRTWGGEGFVGFSFFFLKECGGRRRAVTRPRSSACKAECGRRDRRQGRRDLGVKGGERRGSGGEDE